MGGQMNNDSPAQISGLLVNFQKINLSANSPERGPPGV
jgi:hypothetical protein